MRRRVVSAAVLFTALAMAAGCSNNNKGRPDQAGFGGRSDGVTPSASASASVTPSHSPGASPSAPATTSSSSSGGGLGPVTHSAIASKAAFVWNPNASADYTATGSYWYNSTGGGISIAHTSTGRYTITYAGLGTSGGVAHVQAYGSTSNWCNVVNWGASGADEKVNVACYASNTAPADTQFVANFAVGHQSTAHFSYLWSDQASATGKHNANVTYRYDSTGREPWIERISAGKYRVFLPASYDEQNEPNTIQVTTYGASTFRCKVSKPYAGAGIHEVLCTDAPGTLYDARFVVSFSAEGSIIGRTDNRFGDYTQTSAGVTQSGTGVYNVPAQEMGSPRGQVVATAIGNTASYCHVGNWYPSSTTLIMVVRCYAPNGSPTNAGFRLGVSW
ncbi:MAG TPA: hypothetical protein VFC00_34205 [Micromonosporaceae bacterium]|nr:hypothetical protein [Micromonosporaceae bacterium]